MDVRNRPLIIAITGRVIDHPMHVVFFLSFVLRFIQIIFVTKAINIDIGILSRVPTEFTVRRFVEQNIGEKKRDYRSALPLLLALLLKVGRQTRASQQRDACL